MPSVECILLVYEQTHPLGSALFCRRVLCGLYCSIGDCVCQPRALRGQAASSATYILCLAFNCLYCLLLSHKSGNAADADTQQCKLPAGLWILGIAEVYSYSSSSTRASPIALCADILQSGAPLQEALHSVERGSNSQGLGIVFMTGRPSPSNFCIG